MSAQFVETNTSAAREANYRLLEEIERVATQKGHRNWAAFMRAFLAKNPTLSLSEKQLESTYKVLDHYPGFATMQPVAQKISVAATPKPQDRAVSGITPGYRRGSLLVLDIRGKDALVKCDCGTERTLGLTELPHRLHCSKTCPLNTELMRNRKDAGFWTMQRILDIIKTEGHTNLWGITKGAGGRGAYTAALRFNNTARLQRKIQAALQANITEKALAAVPTMPTPLLPPAPMPKPVKASPSPVTQIKTPTNWQTWAIVAQTVLTAAVLVAMLFRQL